MTDTSNNGSMCVESAFGASETPENMVGCQSAYEAGRNHASPFFFKKVLTSLKAVTAKNWVDSKNDAKVRTQYKEKIKKGSEDVLKRVKEGNIS